MNTKYMLVTPWLSNLRDRAEAVLGSQASAWLATPNRNLGDRVPLDLAGDYFGAQMVIAELARPNAKRARVRWAGDEPPVMGRYRVATGRVCADRTAVRLPTRSVAKLTGAVMSKRTPRPPLWPALLSQWLGVRKDARQDGARFTPIATGDLDMDSALSRTPQDTTRSYYELEKRDRRPDPLLLSGYSSALPTPFNGCFIDEEAFTAFCEWQIDKGISALVVNGTTGEAPTLTADEQRQLVRLAVEVADGRVPVIAGAGSNATSHAIKLARQAEFAGADGLLVVTPYYNRPSQEGLFRHFEALHRATRLPILLYDVPSRTGCTLAVETIVRLATLPRIVGLKDATGDLGRPACLRRLLGDRFCLLSGDDATALDFLAAGGDGCISVVSNVAPRLCVKLHAAWERGDREMAQAIASTLAPLAEALFAESNPVPLKYALEAMSWMSADVRLPLCSASEETRGQIAEALAQLRLVPMGKPVPAEAGQPSGAPASTEQHQREVA